LQNGAAQAHSATAMFDWDDLRFYLAVARHGSTIAAGRALQVNQSTVHRRITALEQRIGRPLVKRQTTGYRLTELVLRHGNNVNIVVMCTCGGKDHGQSCAADRIDLF
jgi:Bacterial regulatory helix-turn-helix protein, lysR family